jgi:hypothetical protein
MKAIRSASEEQSARPDVEPVCPKCKRISWVGWCDFCEVSAVINCTLCHVELSKCSHANLQLPPRDANNTSYIRARLTGGLYLASMSVGRGKGKDQKTYTVIREVWSDRKDALAPLIAASMTGIDANTRILREAAAHALGLRSSLVAGSLSSSALKHAPGATSDSAIQRDSRWPGVLAAAVRFRPMLLTTPHLSPLAVELFTVAQERVGINTPPTQLQITGP